MLEKQYDYLIVGGEHHNMVFTHHKAASLTLEAKRNEIPGFSGRDVPAKTWVPELIEYMVQTWHHNNGKCYYIATTNENAGQKHDIDKMLDEAGIRPAE
ncbi:hypothetical protein WMR35_002082 [Morganella morganii]